MKVILILVAVCLIALVVCYLADDFGDYAAWKPGFVRYVSLLIGDYWEEIVGAVTRIPISTTDGVFRFPNARPQGYFEVGQDVVFINYAYGGVIFESLPEVAEGIVTAIGADADGDIIALAVSGSDEDVRIYSHSSLLVHSWEYRRLKKDPILRRLYCRDAKSTSIEGIGDVIARN